MEDGCTTDTLPISLIVPCYHHHPGERRQTELLIKTNYLSFSALLPFGNLPTNSSRIETGRC